MNAFSADWLRLREPWDQAARVDAAAAHGLPARLARWRARSTRAMLDVIDLACGHGANLRALAPGLGGAQHWRLVDHDPALLAAVPDELADWARRNGYGFKHEGRHGSGGAESALEIAGAGFHARVVTRRLDLARDLASLDLGAAPLVTASALLDLVSPSWLQALVQQARAADAALWFGLTVDGGTVWHPVDPSDTIVHRFFASHQRRDKGFGPALGPEAVAAALREMAIAGYETTQAQTDWVIDGPAAARMQRAMVDGMAAAALEQDPTALDTVQSWQARRSADIGSARLRVGHVDIVATPGRATADEP